MSPAAVAAYPPELAALDWLPLGAGGGFSGAVLWQGRSPAGPAVALKAWPADYPPDRLTAVHQLMRQARSAGCEFVPTLLANRSGATITTAGGRLWDATTWMPGAADFADDPSDARLASAVAALAALHRAWRPAAPVRVPCPGVGRRLALLRAYRPTPPPAAPPPIADPLRRAAELLPAAVPRAVAALSPWAGVPLPVLPCVCDPWHDHLFFTGDRLTGLIDYGAAKPDHPAVDLARLLGDLVSGDAGRVRSGLSAYRDAGGPVEVPDELALALVAAGATCAVLVWLDRVSAGLPPGVSVEAAGRRLERLVARLPPV